MKTYLLNSAVMPSGNYGVYQYTSVTLEEIKNVMLSGRFISRIGYPQNCKLLEKWTGVKVECNRNETFFEDGDIAYVMRLKKRVANPDTKGEPVSENPKDWEFAKITFIESDETLKAECKKILGSVVDELPNRFQKKFFNQFTVFSNEEIKGATIETWESFLNHLSVTERKKDGYYWWNVLVSNIHEWISKTVCIVKVNIFNVPDLFCEISSNKKYAAITYLGKLILIIDADAPDFGYAWIILEIPNYPDNEAWNNFEADFVYNRYMFYWEAVERAKEYAKYLEDRKEE